MSSLNASWLSQLHLSLHPRRVHEASFSDSAQCPREVAVEGCEPVSIALPWLCIQRAFLVALQRPAVLATKRPILRAEIPGVSPAITVISALDTARAGISSSKAMQLGSKQPDLLTHLMEGQQQRRESMCTENSQVGGSGE